MKTKSLVALIFAFVLSLGWSLAQAQVIITPLGSNTGDSCSPDRAFVLEDPTRTRVLYDPGRTVRANDARLGQIDLMILSSVHSDHIGTDSMTQDPDTADNCGGNPVGNVAEPNSAFVAILARLQDAQAGGDGGPIVRVGGEVRDYLKAKLGAECFGPDGINDAGGNDDDFNCSPGDIDTLRHGGNSTVGGVRVAVITAHHSNGIPLSLVDQTAGGLADILTPDDLVPYVGPENGYVLTFTNGLAVYLSGDTGQTADMKYAVANFYNAKVALMNCGDKFSMGPPECAYAVNALIKPRTAIPTHIREAATTGGNAVTNGVVTGAKTLAFIAAVGGANVIVPLSGVEISCNGIGNCSQETLAP